MPTLDWLDREAAFRIAHRVPTRVLRPHPAAPAVGAPPPDGNLLVHGDNLEALKALLPFYRGQVKCIFIDPPYNTKSAFEHYDDNLEHSQWLSMMLPRLQLLREFLREDGSIWVTIDDHEGHYLKVLMDEVFGRRTFVSTIVWENFYGRSNAASISPAHNYIHCYARLGEDWKHVRQLLPRTGKSLEKYTNPNDDPRGPWRLGPIFAPEERHEELMYQVKTPSGRAISPPSGSHWRMLEPEFWALVADGRISFGEKGDNVPALKIFLSEVQAGLVPRSIWSHAEAGHTQDAKREVKALFPGETPFGTPKPEMLIRNIIEVATLRGELVLDSFLGSGTTAAVAHKMGRRWIGVERGEHAVTHCLPRLRKVVQGEQGGISAAVNWQGGGGFRVVQLGAPLFGEHGELHPEVRFADLAAFLWLRETGTAYEPTTSPAQGTPLLGVHEGRAVYLLYNGILGDKRPAAGNVLTSAVLAAMQGFCWHEGPKVVYGEACLLGDARLLAAGITFRQLPHAVPR
jgi:adenine-specific DNA-methyltransferase